MKKKSSWVTILIYVALITLIIVVIATMFSRNKAKDDTWAQILEYCEKGYVGDNEENKISLIQIEGSTLKITYKDGGKDKVIERTLNHEGQLDDIYEIAKRNSQDVDGTEINEKMYDFDDIAAKKTPWIVSYIPYIILVILFIVFMVYSAKQAGGGRIGSFGKSKAKTSTGDKRVTFADVAGADEEKEELEEVVQYLKNPSKFTHLGAKIPHGVLLVGPPGTGKTLLAKAVAGEAGVPFYSMSGSDFVEMYVGVGASRVRDLFENARKSNAAIIFIDEIDAVGRQRGTGLGGGHDEREQTLNQLLVEMDGFDGHSGIIVIAATNRPDILDNALLRPGRFDRQITVGYPDLQGREDILKVHSKEKPFEASVDLHKIAQTTVGFTGADLANLLNESALLAARRGKSLIGMGEIEDAMIKITVGTQKKARRMSDKERKNTACHEAGHAIMSHVLPTQDPVRQISIIPSGRALGYTLTPPVEDKYSESKQEMKERIAMMLGGRVAEQLVFGDYTGGASNDIMRATEVARKMVTVYGMSDELGTIHFGSEHSSDAVFLGRDFNSTPSYSEDTASKIDAEIKKIIDESYQLAKDTLTKYREKLDFITEILLKHEVMDDEQFDLAMQDGTTMEDVENLVTEKKRRSEEENKRRREKLEQERREAMEKRAMLERALGIADDESEEDEKSDEEKSETALLTPGDDVEEENTEDTEKSDSEDNKDSDTEK